MVRKVSISAALWLYLVSAIAQQADLSPSIKIFTTRAISTVLNEIGDEFEKNTATNSTLQMIPPLEWFGRYMLENRLMSSLPRRSK